MNKKTHFNLFFLYILTFGLFSTPLWAITTSGTITGEETWSGTVRLTGDVTVTSSGKLTISPGARIEFAALSDDQIDGLSTSRVELIVDNGTLTASGNADQPILFTSSKATPASQDWYGIRTKGNKVTFQYCTVEYADIGLKVENGVPVLENSTFQFTKSQGVKIDSTSQVTIESCKFLSNEDDGIASYAPLSILDSTFDNQKSDGIYCSNTLRVTNCTFTQNGYGISCGHSYSNYTTIDINNSTFNESSIFFYNCKLNILDSQFTGEGNGIFNPQGVGELNVSLSTFNYKDSPIYHFGGTTYCADCDFYLNQESSFEGIYASTLTLVNCNISNEGAQSQGKGISCSTLNLLHSTVRGFRIINPINDTYMGVGVSFSKVGTMGIAGNTITDNDIGISIQNSLDTKVENIHDNNVYNNIKYELKNKGAAAIVTTENYWGEPTTGEINSGATNLSKIYDVQDDSTVGQVVLRNPKTDIVTLPTLTPTATPMPPTPTVTPTISGTPPTVNVPPMTLWVTDDEWSSENLTGSYDQDYPNYRALVIRWNFGGTTPFEKVDVNVYYRIVGGTWQRLDIYSMPGISSYFDRPQSYVWLPDVWGMGAPSPQFGNSYEFKVFLTYNPGIEIVSAAPVVYISTSDPVPVITPYPTSTATDTPTATNTPTLAATNTPTPTATVVATFTPTLTITPTFTPSPTPTATLIPTDTVTPTFTPSHTPTATLTPTSLPATPTPTPVIIPIPPNTVFVTDDLQSTENLVGGIDWDQPDNRALAIRWNFGEDTFTDYHVNVQINGGDMIYLDRAGTIPYYEWKTGKPNVAASFKDGPQFGNTYQFSIFGLRPNQPALLIQTLDAVTFAQEGTILPGHAWLQPAGQSIEAGREGQLILMFDTINQVLGTYQVKLSWNPDRLVVNSVAEGSSTEFGAPNQVNLTTPGEALFMDVNTDSLTAPTGKVSVATVFFTAKSPGETVITLDVLDCANANGENIPLASIDNATVLVQESTPVEDWQLY